MAASWPNPCVDVPAAFIADGSVSGSPLAPRSFAAPLAPRVQIVAICTVQKTRAAASLPDYFKGRIIMACSSSPTKTTSHFC